MHTYLLETLETWSCSKISHIFMYIRTFGFGFGIRPKARCFSGQIFGFGLKSNAYFRSFTAILIDKILEQFTYILHDKSTILCQFNWKVVLHSVQNWTLLWVNLSVFRLYTFNKSGTYMLDNLWRFLKLKIHLNFKT